MLGRYGSDQFNVFLVILAIVLMILNLFFIRNSFLSAIVWLILIYSLYRIYSRNIYRRRAENDKYLSIIQPIQKRISMIKKIEKIMSINIFYVLSVNRLLEFLEDMEKSLLLVLSVVINLIKKLILF